MPQSGGCTSCFIFKAEEVTEALNTQKMGARVCKLDLGGRWLTSCLLLGYSYRVCFSGRLWNFLYTSCSRAALEDSRTDALLCLKRHNRVRECDASPGNRGARDWVAMATPTHSATGREKTEVGESEAARGEMWEKTAASSDGGQKMEAA